MNCLNCHLPIEVEEKYLGQSLSCDNCKSENFAEYFSNVRVYVKVKTAEGKTVLFGRCNNSECNAYNAENSYFKDSGLLDYGGPKNFMPGDTDCPECDTPNRLIATIVSR